MGSAAAGKFQDHYKVFGVDPKASTAEIHAAYTKQIEQYHPERGKTPDREKYDAAQLAFEVLSDPEGRKVFDAVRGGGEDEAEVTFSGMSFFTDMRQDVDRRNVILIVLYDHKRQKPRTPAITRRQLDMLIQMSEEDVQLAIWYLKDRNLMVVDDRSKMQITAAGMDYLQANLPDPRTILPFLKLKQEVAAESPAELEDAPLEPVGESVEAPSPRYLNLVPLNGLANLAASVAQESPRIEIEVPESEQELDEAVVAQSTVPGSSFSGSNASAPPGTEKSSTGAAADVTIEASRPRLMNIVRRSLTLP